MDQTPLWENFENSVYLRTQFAIIMRDQTEEYTDKETRRIGVWYKDGKGITHAGDVREFTTSHGDYYYNCRLVDGSVVTIERYAPDGSDVTRWRELAGEPTEQAERLGKAIEEAPQQ